MKRFGKFGFMLSIGILFLTGCAYNNATVKYAEKNNLSKKLYNNVMIKCVTKKDLNDSYRFLLRRKLGMKLDEKLKYECRDYLKYHRGSEAQKLYQECVQSYGDSNLTNIKTRYVDGIAVDDISFKTKKGKEKLIGSMGLDKNKDLTVLFYRAELGYLKFMNEVMSEYVLEAKADCELEMKY